MKLERLFSQQHIKVVSLILCSCISSLIYSQTFQWVKPVSGPGQNVGMSITMDESGNTYTAGWFSGTSDFDPGPGNFNMTCNGTYDGFIQKLDPNGNLIWAKKTGGNFFQATVYVHHITYDSAGYLYTVGLFKDMVDFDPGSGVHNLVSADAGGKFSGYIQKLDLNGNFIWAVQIDSCIPNSVAIDNYGNSYITGNFGSAADFDPGPGTFFLYSAGWGDIFVLKLSPSGNFVRAVQMGGIYDDVSYDVALDNSANIHLTGTYSGIADFDPGPGIFYLPAGPGAFDLFVTKLDSLGNLLWANGMTGVNWGDHETYGIAVDADNNVYTAGSFNDSVDFDPGAGNYSLTAYSILDGHPDIYIQKLDGNGNMIWTKQIGGPRAEWAYNLCIDQSANLYVTGPFIDTVDFDPGPGSYFLNAIALDSYVIKIDSSGSFQWARQFSSTDSTSVYSYSVVASASAAYVTGTFESNTDFDPSGSTFFLNAVGVVDAYTVKLSQPLETNEIWENNNIITIYPNPAQTYITVQANENMKWAEIYDITGSLVLNSSLKKGTNNLPLHMFSSGCYLIIIRNNSLDPLGSGKILVHR